MRLSCLSFDLLLLERRSLKLLTLLPTSLPAVCLHGRVMMTSSLFTSPRQIFLWEQNLEQFHMDLFRYRCYLSSLQGGELPNPKRLLAFASRPTKLAMGRLGIFSVSSFHVLVSTVYQAPVSPPVTGSPSLLPCYGLVELYLVVYWLPKKVSVNLLNMYLMVRSTVKSGHTH